jgi:hypothetical protein
MAIIKSLGLQLAIGSTFGTSVTMSAVTNAAEAVATLGTGHSIIVGDIIEVLTSGWPRLARRVVRAKTVATNDVTLELVDTSSTANFPTGEGAGTVREVTAWTSITQLRPEFGSTGGGFEQDDITQMTDVRRINRPGLAEAVTLDFTAFFDPSLAWVPTVRAASQGAVLTPFRIITAGLQKIYGNAYWGLNEEPVPENNSLIYRLNLSLVSDSITYST